MRLWCRHRKTFEMGHGLGGWFPMTMSWAVSSSEYFTDSAQRVVS
jgi:hypothetical protein